MEAKVDKRRVTIIGSGIIGRCWTSLFVRAQFEVALFDTSDEQLQGAQKDIEQKLTILEAEGLLGEAKTASQCMKNVSFFNNLQNAIDGAVYIQECIPESVSLKQQVFSDLDQLVGDNVILASSTSCILPSTFTEQLKHRSHCLVAHPVNPPHYIPVVEVVPAPWTEESVVDQTVALMRELGQAPVRLNKEVNGFLINRLQYALIMEAWRLVEDGIASPDDVDTAISQGLGLRYSFMGPFETMHLNADGVEDYCKKYGANILDVCKSQSPSRPLSGSTLDVVKEAMERKVPCEDLNARRKWRDSRLAALAINSKDLA